jgi:hypothetical protein
MGKILAAAKYLNRNPQTVARKAQKGALPALKIGNWWHLGWRGLTDGLRIGQTKESEKRTSRIA